MRGWLAVEGFAERACGAPVTDHRSSWTRRCTIGSNDLFIKTYDYAARRDRLRGWLRNTGPLVRSRAAAEFDALQWQRDHGFATVQPLAVFEQRAFLALRRAVLVTAAHPGTPTDRLMAELAFGQRTVLAASIGRLVAALHTAGFRDRNLDLRNLLAEPCAVQGFRVANLDSPRHRLVRPGPARDHLARADWRRLLPQLQPFGVAEHAYCAACPAWPLAELLGAS